MKIRGTDFAKDHTPDQKGRRSEVGIQLKAANISGHGREAQIRLTQNMEVLEGEVREIKPTGQKCPFAFLFVCGLLNYWAKTVKLHLAIIPTNIWSLIR